MMNKKFSPEQLRPITETVMIFIFSLLSAVITKAITGDLVAAIISGMITSAQMIICYRIDRMERNLASAKQIVINA